MKNIIILTFVLLLLFGCNSKEFYIMNNKTLIHSTEGYEDYSQYDIKVLYYPVNDNIYYNNWKIYNNKKDKKLLAYGEKKGTTYTITNLWNNGQLKEVKKIDDSKKIFYFALYCDNGLKVLEKIGNPLNPIDTLYYCNGKIQYLFNKLNGSAIYFENTGDTSMVGNYKDNFLKDGLWKHKVFDENKMYYEIYKEGKMVYSGDSIPSWYNK